MQLLRAGTGHHVPSVTPDSSGDIAFDLMHQLLLRSS